MTVLFAEDNEYVLEQMTTTLKMFFSNVITASNGCDAYEKYLFRSVDLIITDMSMPTADGTVLIDRVRNRDKHIPIIVMTAHEEFRHIYDSIDNIYVLIKPINLYDMLDSLEAIEEKIEHNKKINDAYEDLHKAQNEAREALAKIWNKGGMDV